MTAAVSVSAAASALPGWLALERLSPFDAYAQAMGRVMRGMAPLDRAVDGELMRRVFASLSGNALKFTAARERR